MLKFKYNVDSVRVLHLAHDKLPPNFTLDSLPYKEPFMYVDLAHISVVDTTDEDYDFTVLEPTDTGIVDLVNEGFQGYPMWVGYFNASCTKRANVPNFNIFSLVAPVLKKSDYAQIVKLEYHGETIWVSDTAPYNKYSVVVSYDKEYVRITNEVLEAWLTKEVVTTVFVAEYQNPKESLLESCNRCAYVIKDPEVYKRRLQDFIDAHYNKAVDRATYQANEIFYGEQVEGAMLTPQESKRYQRLFKAILAVEKTRIGSKRELTQLFDSSKLTEIFASFDLMLDVLIVK